MSSRSHRGTLGIFVGGKSSRMGGHAKGLLPASDTGQPLLLRTAELAQALGLEAVLVGDASPYAGLLPELERISDLPLGIGPLGGLSGLLQARSDGPVLAVACDMPRLSRALLARFLSEESHAAVLATRGSAGFWEPLCARYLPSLVTPGLKLALADGVRSFQALFARLPVCELALGDDERAQLLDWDAPEDLQH
jgi:molybdopterin-guanine dinucleotide biosynthesis protein A